MFLRQQTKDLRKCDKRQLVRLLPLASVKKFVRGLVSANAAEEIVVSDIDIELDICNMWQKYSFLGIKNLSYVKFDYPFALSLLSVESLIPR